MKPATLKLKSEVCNWQTKDYHWCEPQWAAEPCAHTTSSCDRLSAPMAISTEDLAKPLLLMVANLFTSLHVYFCRLQLKGGLFGLLVYLPFNHIYVNVCDFSRL